MYRLGEQSNRGICVAVIKNIMFRFTSDKSLFSNGEGYRIECIKCFCHETLFKLREIIYVFMYFFNRCASDLSLKLIEIDYAVESSGMDRKFIVYRKRLYYS